MILGIQQVLRLEFLSSGFWKFWTFTHVLGLNPFLPVTTFVYSGKSDTIRESNQASGVRKTRYA